MKKVKGLTVIEVVIGCAIIAILAAIIIFPRATEDTVRITVTDKVVKRYDESDVYLIFTEDETFKISDELSYLRYDSSDLYGKMKVGKTYDCKVSGWRIHVTSSYRNIIEAEEVG